MQSSKQLEEMRAMLESGQIEQSLHRQSFVDVVDAYITLAVAFITVSEIANAMAEGHWETKH